jgi:molybdopterin-containing oxidoreductase family molybdopterin binding subunit
MSTPTLQQDALQVLCIVRQSSLLDALAQTISNYSLPIHCLGVSTQAGFSTAMESPPDLILADPYALERSNAISYYKALHFRAGNIPLIALLPDDSPEYRDAAIQMGANHTLAWDKVSSDLLPAMKRLLGGTRLIKGISKHIENSAEASAPLGEPAFKQDMSILARSHKSLERLAGQRTIPDETLNHDLFPTQGTTTIQSVFLRGLGTSAVSQVSSSVERVFRTACAHNCGPHFCGLNVTVRGQDITKIEPANFPDEQYRRLCMKGISYVQTRVHPQRLLRPLKRTGKRGEGKWEAVSWEQALDEIAGKMRDFSQIYGSESNVFLTYSGQLSVLNGMNGVYLRLAAALGASGTSLREYGLDSAIPSGIEDTLGVGSGYRANHFTDLPNSRLILIWGGNPAQSNMLWWNFFLEAKRTGTRIVTIDPRFSLTASKSDQWLPVRIGSDLYLALAMLRLIIENDWMDKDFILRHTVAPLLVREDNGKFLQTKGSRHLSDQSKNLVWDEQCDKAVPVNEAGSPVLSGKQRVAGITCRTAFDLLREMLQPYTPEFASTKTGLDAQQIIELSREVAETTPTRIFTLYGIDRWHHGATFGRLIATIAAFTGNLGIPGGGAGVSGSPESALPDSEFYTPNGREHCPINPLMLPDQILSAQPHPVKSVFVAFGNWINQFPDQNRMHREILSKLDMLVVADHFMTETARWADYVLPAAFFFEREDMVKGPGPYVQYQPAIVPPAGESRSDFEIAAALAERLGCEEVFAKTPGEYLAEILAYNESMQHISLDVLREKGVMEREMPPEWEIAHRDRQFKTLSGRVEFYVERLLPLGRALPQYEAPIEAFPENELIAQYPLVCLTEHSRYRVHSTFSNAPWLREIENEPYASMNPEDAQQRDISEKDYVKIFNARGWVVLRAHLTQAVPPGAVYLSQGWQSDDFHAGHAQSLTHSVWNPANAFGANSSFSDVLVDVTKEEKTG